MAALLRPEEREDRGGNGWHMRLLHTSDWHLGRTLYGRQRYEEHEQFLDWLLGRLSAEAVDVLVVAGDIFDSATPSHRAQELYYRWLCRLPATGCQHVVIVGGNHDSPSLLNAPRELLRRLDIHVLGGARPNSEDEVMVLDDARNGAALVVCAVPYLRDRDVRRAEAGESIEDKARKLVEGIVDHYRQVAEVARAKVRARGGERLSVVATGHLFTTGGQTMDGDGVRDLYVGSLGHVGREAFPDLFDYVALGHLHVPQRVGGSPTHRYCGSPLPMSFGEAPQQKMVLMVELGSGLPEVMEVPVPCFQVLDTVRGDEAAIIAQIQALKDRGESRWLDVIFEGDRQAVDLQEQLRQLTDGSQLELLRVRNPRTREQVLRQMQEGETLDDLDERQVFLRCLDQYDIDDNARDNLLAAFGEVLAEVHQADLRAEEDGRG